MEDLTPWLPPVSEAERNPFARYQSDPVAYAEEVLGLTPWSGCTEKGQRELLADIGESARKQLAGERAIQIFRVEAGNGVGKTFAGAMLVNWFFDAFAPSIAITTAPTKQSVEELLWKDIKKIRPSHLPGRVLPSEPRMVKGYDHWAIGKTTSDAGGRGEERMKGQHDKYLLFVLDEAEGLAKFVFDAIVRMMTGGLVILVVVFANPRTRTSEFYKLGQRPNVLNYRLSALDHPNVVQGAEVVPGATSREWVDERLDGGWCEAVPEHSEDDYTFEVPWRPGIIYRPNTEFLCALLGIPPANSSADTLIPVGRYEAACKRREKLTGTEVRMGVDVARWGDDAGTLYARHGNHCWRVAKLTKKDTTAYAGAIRQEALRLAATGTARSLHVRVDAGGGFGGGVIDQIKHDPELKAAFPDFQAFEVDFGGKAYTPKSYHLLVTELYAETAETLKGICLLNAPEELRGDLTERKYKWVNVAGIAVKQLEPKDEIRKPQRLGRSPDDGDGFVLCAAPDFLFTHKRREWTFG